jgi:hypothetical protein
MYVGFIPFSFGIGWTLEAKVGPWLYGEYASKETFSRELLFESFGDRCDRQWGSIYRFGCPYGSIAEVLTALLRSPRDITFMWYVMGAVGFAAVIGMFGYGKWLGRLKRDSQ